MRDIAIIGSGIAGLALAHGLRRAGYAVTIYSDRSAEQWLHESRPTGTAARFELALSYERQLGLNHWDDVLPWGEGVFLTFCPTLHNRLVTLLGRDAHGFQAVDLRLQCHRWMNDFDGELRIEPVSVARLDEIAKQHELTVVAAGRAELSRLFERDAARSTYDAPQRNLAMIIVRNMRMAVDGCPYLPVKFDFLGTDGELFFIPYWHKDHGRTWNILFEAKAGSRMDRFGEVKNGEEAVAIAKEVIRELFPWDAEWVRDMELADKNGWLIGRVTPAVRKPVGVLPSGRIVTAIGDTAISVDPIAAQGANTGIKHARHFVSEIVKRERRPFDAQWMASAFESFYDEHAREAIRFSNLLLEDLTPAAQEILIAQYGSDGRAENQSGKQRIADAFFANFSDPRTLTPMLTDVARARNFIAMTTGRPWIWNAARGRAAVARDQVRQKLQTRALRRA